MTTKLRLYNAALTLCGQAAISALTEQTEARRLLDLAWDNGAVRSVLEKGSWIFAERTQRLDFDPSFDPDFGFRRAFQKGSDWVSTNAVCSDEFFQSPLLRYSDEAGFLYADEDFIYVKFVSDDVAFGADLSTWTNSFTEYAEAFMASKIIFKLTSDKDRVTFLMGADASGTKSGYMHQKLRTARSSDARQDPTKFPPPGSWVMSRGGFWRGRGPMGDGGSGGSLIG